MNESQTIAACLTPPGVAALAVIAVRGPQAWPIARALFHPRGASTQLPDEIKPGQIWLGKFGAEATDDVVLIAKGSNSSVQLTSPTRKQGGAESTHSGTWIEIQCHGGREIVRMLLEALEVRGVRVCSWPEWECANSHDPIRAQAVTALAGAKTTRTAAVLLDQLNGALRRAVDEVLLLLRSGSLIEAEERIAALDGYSEFGRHLTTPWRVVIAGAPNVGKSSLINALTGYQRSIVAPSPGTTRDVVTTLVALDGWPVELADTAGMRLEAEALEAVGIKLARETASSADLILWVVDASAPPIWPDAALGEVRLLVNKIDLPTTWDLELAGEAIAVSALTGAGIVELSAAITHWLVPDPPKSGAAVPFTPELADCITEALGLCRAGQAKDAANALEKVSVLDESVQRR